MIQDESKNLINNEKPRSVWSVHFPLKPCVSVFSNIIWQFYLKVLAQLSQGLHIGSQLTLLWPLPDWCIVHIWLYCQCCLWNNSGNLLLKYFLHFSCLSYLYLHRTIKGLIVLYAAQCTEWYETAGFSSSARAGREACKYLVCSKKKKNLFGLFH